MSSYVEDPCRATPRVHAAPSRGSMPRYVKPYTVWPDPTANFITNSKNFITRLCQLFFSAYFSRIFIILIKSDHPELPGGFSGRIFFKSDGFSSDADI